MKKDCEPLTPSFKVRILITGKASNKVLNACVQVLTPLPQKRAEISALFLFISPIFACVYDIDIFRIL